MKSIKLPVKKATAKSSSFTLVKDKDLGDILFGCPPEIVKFFDLSKTPIFPDIVIPQRTFRKGKNYFDLEFVIYFILFFQKSKKLITIACTDYQEQCIRTVLDEALFGPCLKDIFRAFLFGSFNKIRLNRSQLKFLEKIAKRIGASTEIFSRFSEIMSLNAEESKVVSKIRPVLRNAIDSISWFDEELYNQIYRMTTKAYVKAAMLKLEMEIFSICKEEDRDAFISKFIDFRHYDSNGRVTLGSEKGPKIKIQHTISGSFKLYKKQKLINSFNIQLKDEDKKFKQIASSPFEVPELGITFLGSGTGFDPETNTNCFIIWIDGKGFAVDLLADCEEHFRQLGIASNDIAHVFLSHLHSDHDAGLLEKLFIGEKIHLLTSKLIFDSFLRKAEAVTRFNKNTLISFVDFIDLKEGKEIRIPGIDRAYITFDYAFHSIPSGRFKLRYISRAGKEIKIGYSGDTKYDKKLVNKLYKEKKITAARRDGILGFLWDCDLIIHEAGGGMLHTEVKELKELPGNIQKKCILTHTDQRTRKLKGFHFAKEGETIFLLKQEQHVSMSDFIPLINNTGLFQGFTYKQFDTLLKDCVIETFSEGQYVFKQGTIGHKFYIVLSGFAEVVKDKKVLSIYEKGGFFGELALISKDKKRRATIRAKSKLHLLVIDRNLYKEFHLSTIIKERMYDLTNYFSDAISSSLIGYISRGEFMVFMKGDKIISLGETSKDVYILLSGTVGIFDAKKKLIAYIKDVEILGEMSFLKDIPRTATITVTSKQATIIRLNAKLFAKISKKFPFFYATILKKMDRRWEVLVFKKKA